MEKRAGPRVCGMVEVGAALCYGMSETRALTAMVVVGGGGGERGSQRVLCLWRAPENNGGMVVSSGRALERNRVVWGPGGRAPS